MMVVPLSNDFPATVDQVGGKGLSLMRLRSQGWQVPDGVILTTAFFQPWFEKLAETPIWSALLQSDLTTFAQGIVTQIDSLSWTPAQRSALRTVHAELEPGPADRYAIRSSSPDEDLDRASFAGGYATQLNVTPAAFEIAIRSCFRAALSERVLVYQQEHHFDFTKPRLALVIQKQLDSTVSGVAFSLNPQTNDFDQAVISANWGQGETVVSGSITPDHYVVDKVSLGLIEKKLGSKESSAWLAENGSGLRTEEQFRSREWTLTEKQITAITKALTQIESHDGHPVDVEWAYTDGDANGDGDLHLLQARPITSYVPLAESMQTHPGEPRQVYLDAGLMEGASVNAPLSTLSLSWMEDLAESFPLDYIQPQANESIFIIDGCRTYINLSVAFWFTSPKAIATRYDNMDVIASRILRGLDPSIYRTKRRPKTLRWMRLKGAWLLKAFFFSTLHACILPNRFLRRYERVTRDHEARLNAAIDKETFPDDYEDLLNEFSEVFLRFTLPTVAAFWLGGRLQARALFRFSPPDIVALSEDLDQGLPKELIVEMGVQMYQLSQLLDRASLTDLPALAERIEKRELPASFMKRWDAFMERFGSRGPGEMELSNARYGDDPELLLQQLAGMAAVKDAKQNPESMHQHHLRQRQQALTSLQAYLRQRWWRRWRLGPLRWAYHLITCFGGARDTPKHHIALLTQYVRRWALARGEELVRQNRLDQPEDVFGLKTAELKERDDQADAPRQALVKERFQFYHKLQKHVRHFPHVIDSRGRILRPPETQSTSPDPGMLQGMPISRGLHRGPIRILERPDPTAIAPGEILVTYVTDPGWTPLFIHAGAIVLEVGGALQHGAIVAREYGKPCVVGIEDVTTRLRDGDLAEVDGGAGTVRLLPKPESR